MSYGNCLGEVEFLIKAENVKNALTEVKNHFLKAGEQDVACIKSFNEIICKFGLEVFITKEGNITDLTTIDAGLEMIPYEFFDMIAKYVENGSFVEFNGDDYEHYMIKFRNGKYEKITGQVIYPDSTQLSYDRMDALLNAVVSHEFVARKSIDAAENLLHIGFTGEELIKTFGVDADDVREATRIIEEG